MTRRLLPCLFALLFSLPLLGQVANPISSFLKQRLPDNEKHFVDSAELMPAEKYNYRPTPAQMTFGHAILHVSQSNVFLCSRISGAPAPKVEKLSDTDAKDKLIGALKDSFHYCSQVLAPLDDSKLGDEVDFFGGHKVARGAAMMVLLGDWYDHYAGLAIYLRLNGILPPTARPAK
ncbi:MAG: DinB family protein [Terriglobales bacterium]